MSVYADQGTAAHSVLERCLNLIYRIDYPATARDYLGTMVTIDKQDDVHALTSPSSAKRWLRSTKEGPFGCTASVAMQQLFPEKEDGEPRQITIEEEDVAAVQMALDYVADRVKHYDSIWGQGTTQVFSERKVSPVRFLGTHDCDGISDVTLLNLTGKQIEHIDYKHGRGVPVPAEDPQNDLYLLGTLAELNTADIQSAVLTIVQPRCDKIEPRIRSRLIKDVGMWRDLTIQRVLGARKEIEETQGIFRPSEDACRFCDAKGHCKALADHIAQVLPPEELSALPETREGLYDVGWYQARGDIRTLSTEQIIGILDIREMIAGFLNAVAQRALNELQTGTAAPELVAAYEIGAGRSQRRWCNDEAETERLLKKIKFEDPDTGKKRGLGRKELYKSGLDSVAGVERKLKQFKIGDTGWKVFKGLYEMPEGKPTLVQRSMPLAERKSDAPQEAFNVDAAFEGPKDPRQADPGDSEVPKDASEAPPWDSSESPTKSDSTPY